MALNADGVPALDLVPKKQRGHFEELRYVSNLGYAAFISHMKVEAQTEARSLKESVEQRLKRRVFLEYAAPPLPRPSLPACPPSLPAPPPLSPCVPPLLPA